MLIRREAPDDVAAIRSVTTAAFTRAEHSAPAVGGDDVPGEATLVEWLRADPGWIPELALVAVDGDPGAPGSPGPVIGHVVCTRGWVGDRPALGLGPVGVTPERQGAGVGSALMHAVLGAAEALHEPLVAVLGEPGYYGRFGFRPAGPYGVEPPDPSWGDYFQVRTLSTDAPSMTGVFAYAEPFSRL